MRGIALIRAWRRIRAGRDIGGHPVRPDPDRHNARSGGMVDTSSTQAYTSWWQARSDTWSRLEQVSGQLAAAFLAGRAGEGLAETTSGLLEALAPAERYWAYPGPEAFRLVRDLFAAASYGRFALLVGRITRALVTQSYRAGAGWSLAEADHGEAEAEDEAAGPGGHDRPGRPYFEVLVVDELTPAQQHLVREEVRGWRRPDDPFVYELVVVGSAEEAIIAARLNANLQACVIGRRFAAAAGQDLSSLADFADITIAGDLAGQAPDERYQILARRLARVRPELDLYLLTEMDVEDTAGYLSHHFRRVFHAQERSLELHESILAGVAARYRTPFFEALRHYSHQPGSVFHALPISQGNSIISSHWITDMAGFYGVDIFLAE